MAQSGRLANSEASECNFRAAKNSADVLGLTIQIFSNKPPKNNQLSPLRSSPGLPYDINRLRHKSTRFPTPQCPACAGVTELLGNDYNAATEIPLGTLFVARALPAQPLPLAPLPPPGYPPIGQERPNKGTIYGLPRLNASQNFPLFHCFPNGCSERCGAGARWAIAKGGTEEGTLEALENSLLDSLSSSLEVSPGESPDKTLRPLPPWELNLPGSSLESSPSECLGSNQISRKSPESH
ncbi:hypothetical protein OUZ56_026432 [Daphnia magna]|uniref:Uncharacterized protein n=1 Tax=Daphnia magna TaxID=35525 RepID=A0ABQ9ZLQ7_9CRUS|nr:hypothetical protein OUZ56_026432 [Daphnia magna]